jgi:hypothetical protein
MGESAEKTSGQYLIKIFLWCLRRPIGIWLVLLFSITSVVVPISMMVTNSEQMISLMGLAQFTQILIPHLVPVLVCIIAGLLALFMKKESIVLFIIYLLIYLFYAFKVGFNDSNITLQATVQVVICLSVIAYLMYLKKLGRLK